MFGSVARGDANHDSDLDLLIDVGPRTTSWFPAGLILDLEKLLDCRVEVVTEKALNPDPFLMSWREPHCRFFHPDNPDN
ncbi:MAG: nucleotidyltransferase domain-containing protein [Blastocatellia bacterium]